MNRPLLCLLLTGPLLGCGYITAPEVHLIPDGYRGDVYIVSDMPQGASPEREGFGIVFKIPPDGVLVTQDKPSQGWHSAKFFYVDPAGTRRRIEIEPSSVHDTPENRADTRPVVWFQRTSKIESTDLPCPVEFSQYYVGTRSQLLSRNPADDDVRFRAYLKEHHVCR